jgi:hypothetical protein
MVLRAGANTKDKANISPMLAPTKAMALVGASIGLMFAVSLVLSPLLAAWIGLSGLFSLTALLAVLGAAVVIWAVPPEPVLHKDAARGGLRGQL